MHRRPVALLAPEVGPPAAALPGDVDRLFEPAPLARAHAHAVDDDLDAHVRRRRVARPNAVDLAHRPSDDEATVAIFRQRLTERQELIGVLDSHWIRHERARPVERLDRARGGDARGRAHRFLAAIGARRHRLAREERGKVRLEIGHRRERRSTRLHGRAAIDGDGGGDRLEGIHRRALEALEKLPRVGAEALDEAPLPFGVERVERERRLSRAARPRQRDELPGGQLEVNPTEVVCPGASEENRKHRAWDYAASSRRAEAPRARNLTRVRQEKGVRRRGVRREASADRDDAQPHISTSWSTVRQLRPVLVVRSFESKYAFVSLLLPTPFGHDT